MSFNALSNVARRKNKAEKNSKEYNLYKSGRKGYYSFKYSHRPPPPPTLFQCWNITDHMRIEEYR